MVMDSSEGRLISIEATCHSVRMEVSERPAQYPKSWTQPPG